MAAFGERAIAYAEHVADGLLIVFVDGESAVYTASFLRENLPEMKKTDPIRRLPTLISNPHRHINRSGDS
ncbi:hypothetical protein [Granulicella arctica]|uniref:hypothetical protein n=1 Tax=Granulicella arctica TaxID=940613 RepID=UPI0021E06BF6|nr:hypothetical protein [Granulicella arctica]